MASSFLQDLIKKEYSSDKPQIFNLSTIANPKRFSFHFGLIFDPWYEMLHFLVTLFKVGYLSVDYILAATKARQGRSVRC